MTTKNKTNLIKVVLVGTASLALFNAFRTIIKNTTLKEHCYKLTSKLLDVVLEQPTLPVHVIRSAFRSTTIPEMNPNLRGHSHPHSAAARSSCIPFSNLFALSLGLKTFSVQGSTADVKNGENYNRTHYWGKDLLVPANLAEPNENELPVIVDVDYYMDMNKYLLGRKLPIMLYSCQPSAAAFSGTEYSYTFNKDNEIIYNVKGGANYKHEIWNYNKDIIVVSNWWTRTFFQVERMQVDQNHEFITLIPIGSYYGIFAYLAKLLSASELTRLKPNVGEFNVIDYQEKRGLYTSIARVDGYATAYIPRTLLDTMRSAIKVSTVKTGVAGIQSWMEAEGGRHGAAVICDYLQNCDKSAKEILFPPETGSIRYQLLRKIEDYSPDAKPLLSSYMTPLVAAGYVPDSTLENEVAAVMTRVLAPAVDAKKLIATANAPPRWIINCMNEFIKLLIPNMHLGRPVELETVYEKQNRPSQRSLLNRAETGIMPIHSKISTFLKAENYQKPGDPRIISTYDTVIKRDYSAYTYSLTQYIADNHRDWYTFGSTPIEIANRVTTICTTYTKIICADANKMDGHVSHLVRDLELAILLAFFHQSEHASIRLYHAKQYNGIASTPHKFTYPVDFQRGSGSPETALFNTILTKFIDFCYRRKTMSALEAFNAPSQCGGDDSIVGLAGPITDLVNVAAMLGQRYEVEVIERGNYGVNYLSRYYTTNVWYGDPTSTCDLKRILSKIHMGSNNMDVPAIEKLRRKLCGLARTDHDTPIISDIINAAKRVGMQLHDSELSESWWAQYELNTNWPNSQPEDIKFYLDYFLPHCSLDDFYFYISNVKTELDLLTLPLITEKVIAPPNKNFITVMEDEVKYPEQPMLEPAEPITETKEPVTILPACKNFLFNNCSRKNCKYSHIKASTTKLGTTEYRLDDSSQKINYDDIPIGSYYNACDRPDWLDNDHEVGRHEHKTHVLSNQSTQPTQSPAPSTDSTSSSTTYASSNLSKSSTTKGQTSKRPPLKRNRVSA